MKPPAIPLEDIIALPLIYQTTIPPEYRDENGHMNVRWYMTIFDEAGYPFVAMLGITPEFHQQHGTGGFDLEHHLHYLNEVHVGDNIAVYVRVLGRSAKRIHYMMFMVNETRGTLASIYLRVCQFVRGLDNSAYRSLPAGDRGED